MLGLEDTIARIEQFIKNPNLVRPKNFTEKFANPNPKFTKIIF